MLWRDLESVDINYRNIADSIEDTLRRVTPEELVVTKEDVATDIR